MSKKTIATDLTYKNNIVVGTTLYILKPVYFQLGIVRSLMFNIALTRTKYVILLRQRAVSSVYFKVLLFKLRSHIVCIMNQKCLNSPDLFCFVCGEFNSSSNRERPTPLLYNIYDLYFGFKISKSINRSWTPSFSCLR